MWAAGSALDTLGGCVTLIDLLLCCCCCCCQVAREIAIAMEDLVTGTVTAVDANGVTVSYTLSDDTPVQVGVGGWVFLWGAQQLILLWLCICF